MFQAGKIILDYFVFVFSNIANKFSACFGPVSENFGKQKQLFSHIYRRLQWLGNRLYSHLATLIYLAVWHGYHLGYFVLFTFEFSCVVAQKQVGN